MKTSILHRTAMVSVILLNRLFHGDSALADGCPTPSFAAARTFDVGARPTSVVVGDFNGDGKLDLAVADFGSFDPSSGSYANNGLSVLVGTGDGAFLASL